MDLSMILNNDGDDGGYASSPSQSPRASHIPASTRWSVDEMRNAVSILSDFQGPTEETAARSERRIFSHAPQNSYEVDDEETEDERDLRYRRPAPPPSRPAPRSLSPPPHAAPASSAFSGLDLLFQADAMIQKRASPERPSSRTEKLQSKKAKKITKQPIKKSHLPRAEEPTLEDDDDDDDDLEGTPKRSLASSQTYLRSGFWTRAEEEYAAALIFYFLRGALPIAEGTTLRKYLAEQLCCNRRRVSMKLATETIADKKIPRKVGASVFVALKPAPSDDDRDHVRGVLDKLRRDCFREVAQASGATNNQEDDEDTDDMRTPRQVAMGSSTQQPLSPLVLNASSELTPARRKAATSKPTPSPKKRRPSVTSSSSNTRASPPNIKRRRPMIIRTGFETPEEEEFVTALVEYFTDGLLELNDDTRLVTYLCEQLDCSPKTLSMKLAPRRMGEHKFPSTIGTMVYTRKDDDDASSEIFEAEAHVFELRQNWLQARDQGAANHTEDEREEKSSVVSSSPASTPSRKTKAEPTTRVLVATPPKTTTTTKSLTNGPRSYSRSGPWSRHEEEYAAGLIDCFFRGVLDISEGTTLRAFLTSRLNCNPMRISKKLASHTIADVKIPKKLGSATYVRRDGVSDAERRSAEEHLRHLEQLSLSEQHLKEDIVMGVIGNKHTREEEGEPVREQHYGQYTHDEHSVHFESHYPPRHHQYSNESSPVMAVVSPNSSFKMRRILVDDYPHAPPHEQMSEPVPVAGHHRHGHHSSPPGAYDHHDASMRYQRVAY